MRLNNGQSQWMVVKVDLEKAYDRLRWDFIQDSLVHANFPPALIKLIMDFVSTARMRVLWNGDQSEEFAPSRGIHQGDPLSLYLFVICIECLAHIIRDVVGTNKWKPIYINRIAPPISHIFFADDLVLFGDCSVGQIEVMLECLDKFCSSSREKVSKEKTKVFFSKKVSAQLAA